MSSGIDTSTNTTSEANCLQTAIVDGSTLYFVIRYYNVNDPSKNLTLQEATALSNVGLFIVVVWENGYPTSQSYFTNSQGVSDAINAYSYAANTIGQPATTPVYFAVDYDAYTSADQTAISNYFSGVQSGYLQYLQEQHNHGLPPTEYTFGVYGSYDVLTWCKSQGITSYFWQAYAPGWSGGKNSQQWPGVNIQQQSAVSVCSLGCDADLGVNSPGGWKI